MSRNLFEEAILWEQLARKVERFLCEQQSASDQDAMSAEQRDQQALATDPREFK